MVPSDPIVGDEKITPVLIWENHLCSKVVGFKARKYPSHVVMMREPCPPFVPEIPKMGDEKIEDAHVLVAITEPSVEMHAILPG